MVITSARHLLSLINDILDISKIEAGQIEVHTADFDLRESITRVVQSLQPIAAKKGLALVTHIEADVGSTVSDRRRVEQILINLLNNAIKFTDQGQVRVEATLDAGRVVIRVIDTGMAIRAEDLERIFKPFQQLDTGLARQHEGTGLGLSICRRLAVVLGGEITVQSIWKKGSLFTLTLPLTFPAQR